MRRPWRDAVRRRLDIDDLEARVEHLEHAAHVTYRWSQLATAMLALRAVVSAHTFADPPLISVITPTHDRRRLLEHAVASVRAQNYPRWEQLILVDRCSDDTIGYVTALAESDPRVRFKVTDEGRCGAARNQAYEMVNGDFVVYLDDDNQFDPWWLASVAWAFEEYPSLQALYGILVIDHQDRADRTDTPGQLPEMHLHPFDRAALTRDNYVDIGTFAHRAGLVEARFDDELGIFDDWEMFGRVAATTTPLALPALSVIYRTGAPDRLSFDFPGNTIADGIRARLTALFDQPTAD